MRESSRTYVAPKAKGRKKPVNLGIDGDLVRMRKPDRQSAAAKKTKRPASPQRRGGESKKAVNLSLDAALVAEARKTGVNLSRFMEERLAVAMKQKRHDAWRHEAREAMDAYNEFVAENGIFGEEFRRF